MGSAFYSLHPYIHKDMGTRPYGWAVSLGLLLAAVSTIRSQGNFSACDGSDGNVYEFQYKELITGDVHKMDEYSGKVLLVAAVASF